MVPLSGVLIDRAWSGKSRCCPPCAIRRYERANRAHAEDIEVGDPVFEFLLG
jgi:hypothetical protein